MEEEGEKQRRLDQKRKSYHKHREHNLETKAKWRATHKDQILNYDAEYRESHKDYRAEKIPCECGVMIGRTHISTHRKTKRHIKLMQQN